jgi:hypothetical protein
MDYIRYFAKLGAILMAFISCPVLVIIFLRSFKIPVCFSCGATKVRPTRSTGVVDSVVAVFLLKPYRCEGCRQRFHALRWVRSSIPSPHRRVVHVVFRFRKGLPSGAAIRVVNLRITQATKPSASFSRPVPKFPAVYPT